MKRRKMSLILVLFSALLAASFSFADLSGSLDEDAIKKRLQPMGEVTVEAGTAPVAAASAAPAEVGQELYHKYCHICHETGLAGAPKFGDKADWAPRIAEGMDTLLKHAINGYKAMPPKGTCTSCSEADIKQAIEYMVSHAK